MLINVKRDNGVSLFYCTTIGDRTCDCAATIRNGNFLITSTSDVGLYHKQKKDLFSLCFMLINVAGFKATFGSILAFLTKNLMWTWHPLRKVTFGNFFFWQLTQLINWGYHFFCDFYAYEWLPSLFKGYLYLINFNVGNSICCWICMYITHNNFGSGANGSPFLMHGI